MAEPQRRVYNLHHRDAPPGAVYIGRGRGGGTGDWGNPFVIGKDGDREQVVAAFERHLLDSPDLLARVRTELRGAPLVCFCYPLPCHGDVLARYSEEVDQHPEQHSPFDDGAHLEGF